MLLQDYKKNYIISLVDTSENKIENNICMEGFAHHQFLLVDRDGYAISQETKEIPFSSGCVIYIAAGRRFGLRSEGSMNIRHIAFTGRNIRPLLHYCCFGEFCVTSPDNEKNTINNMFDEIFSLQTSTAENKYMTLSGLLYELLAKLGEINIESKSYVHDEKTLLLAPVLEYMQENYRKPTISYENAAAIIGISKNKLDNLFNYSFSLSAEEYYKKLRTENSKHLLFFYKNSGTEYVSRNMGYENVSDFESDFYLYTGMTAKEFISLYWNQNTDL